MGKKKKNTGLGDSSLLQNLMNDLATPTYGDVQLQQKQKEEKQNPIVSEVKQTISPETPQNQDNTFVAEEYGEAPAPGPPPLTEEELKKMKKEQPAPLQNQMPPNKQQVADPSIAKNEQQPQPQAPPQPQPQPPISNTPTGHVPPVSTSQDQGREPVTEQLNPDQPIAGQGQDGNYQETVQDAGHTLLSPERQEGRRDFVGKWGIYGYDQFQKFASILTYQKVNTNKELQAAEDVLVRKAIEGTITEEERNYLKFLRDYLGKCNEKHDRFVENAGMIPELRESLQNMMVDLIDTEQIQLGTGSVGLVAVGMLAMPLMSNGMQIYLDNRSNRQQLKTAVDG